ncbi:hypothetical protein PPERSA_02797 [Pseudocohnilembus persalinus]|uniref:Glucose-methanol-choline oxidoreductase N-terminal domain-containing protein n=1 Tax=Pseudocohnilembus persalinus TaxID=266149 RepID=A0A0V0QMS8_PSEPJ|nr:hypothetical protein PPERSA_02797 [Pseudocohnilembus persalinus]|eukprot:KRX03418.1 hypothetical protein PPERSA_02797 [Pseudocohnilembus persalinus]
MGVGKFQTKISKGKDGRHVRLEARKEIVLTAGAIFNPRILLLTGFGSEEQLKKINVRCLQNIPGIGQNLQDSPQLFLRNLLKLNGKTPLSPSFQNISKINKQFRQFKQQGTGSFSSNLHEVGGQGVTVQLGLQNPLSQGSINLTSRNYDKNPEIELNYLQKDEDLQRLKEGVKQICQIMEQSPIKDFIKKSIDIKSNDSDSNIEKFIKNNIFSGGDPRGTCKMGKSNDSVVDDKFKVHNVNNLRIADCSILPQWISGNQSTMSAMIAEGCFDRIKKEHDI